MQGIRITLNSAGQPAIWEVLADSSTAKLFFVSQKLEAAAMAQFGKPLPGRRFATERSMEAAPDVIVARVIDDGPVVAGPIVYLSADTRAVSTLICRCMPAQARKLLATGTYDLLPFHFASTNSLIIQARFLLQERAAFWPGDDTDGKRLEACLRLPSFLQLRKVILYLRHASPTACRCAPPHELAEGRSRRPGAGTTCFRRGMKKV